MVGNISRCLNGGIKRFYSTNDRLQRLQHEMILTDDKIIIKWYVAKDAEYLKKEILN